MANADILRVLPDWLKGTVQSNLPNNDHDRASARSNNDIELVFVELPKFTKEQQQLETFRDFQQIAEVKTRKETVDFTPPQPVILRAADELTTKNSPGQTINNGNKARLLDR